MSTIQQIQTQLLEAYRKAQEATNPSEKTRWLQEYQRLYRALKIQEAIVFG